MPGQIILLFLAGWKLKETLVTLRLTSEIVFHVLLNWSHPTSGIMLTEPKIQLIALLKAFSLPSYWSMSCGGVLQNGYDLHLPVGPSKRLFH